MGPPGIRFGGKMEQEEAFVKRIALWSLSALLCTGFVVAQDAMKKDDHMKSDSKMMSGKMMTAKGMVTKVDESGKMMMMKDSKGKEMMMNWDASTKMTGEMKEGSKATVKYMMMDGKMMAHEVKMSGGKKMMSDKKM